jgi:diamine N-acetyltransferase
MDAENAWVHFRPATNADIPVLRDLAQTIWRACYPSIVSFEQIDFMLGWMYSEQQIRGELEKGVRWEVIEDSDGAAIGFVSFHLENDGRVKLNKLYILPELHGRGIGTRALDHVIERARDLGGRAVWMQVNKRNHRAVAVYQKAGFRIAQEAVFEIGGGFVMDDYLMEKVVDDPGKAASV